jgi:hypothetical protein
MKWPNPSPLLKSSGTPVVNSATPAGNSHDARLNEGERDQTPDGQSQPKVTPVTSPYTTPSKTNLNVMDYFYPFQMESGRAPIA